MKSISTLAALALLAFAAGTANAQAVDPCAAKQVTNAAIIAKAQAAKTAPARKKIIQAALDADPANAICLIDLAIQMNQNIEPAAGPEGTGQDFGAGTTPPAENPNQLNQGTNGNPASPASPAPAGPTL